MLTKSTKKSKLISSSGIDDRDVCAFSLPMSCKHHEQKSEHLPLFLFLFCFPLQRLNLEGLFLSIAYPFNVSFTTETLSSIKASCDSEHIISSSKNSTLRHHEKSETRAIFRNLRETGITRAQKHR